MAALRNAITADMALGCSTNSALHLPAIAHEAGLRLDLKLFNEISERTPNLCHLAASRRALHGGAGGGRAASAP